MFDELWFYAQARITVGVCQALHNRRPLRLSPVTELRRK